MKTYDDLFRILYNMDVRLPADDFQGLVGEAMSILQAAEKLGAAKAVRRVLETHLLRANQLLWQRISTHPAVWADFGVRLQSPSIFQEAMIHIIGARGAQTEHTANLMRTGTQHGEKIMEIIARKGNEEDAKKKTIDRHLLSYFPRVMRRHAVVGEKVPGRADYCNDLYHWLALSLVRQFLSHAFFTDHHRQAADGGAGFYRTIAAGGDDTYLGRDSDEANSFFALFPMTKKAMVLFYNALREVKEALKPIVAEILKSRLLLINGHNGEPLPYLTNIEILEDEMPWYEKPAESDDGTHHSTDLDDDSECGDIEMVDGNMANNIDAFADQSTVHKVGRPRRAST